jgi:hypothetical protein
MSQETEYFTCIEMAVYDTSALTGTFAVLNGPTQYTIFTGIGFQDTIKLLKFYNGSTMGVTLSYDGVTQNDFLPPGATLILDLQTNHPATLNFSSGTKIGRKGQIIYGKGTAGVGLLYISGYR